MSRLSQMILDRVFFGILDQGAGCLNVFEEPQRATYSGTLQTIDKIGEIVDVRSSILLVLCMVLTVYRACTPKRRD